MFPEDLYYTKDHEWVRVEGDRATVGITDYAQRELGDIVYVELPEVGRKVKAGEVLCSIDSVKASSEVYAPLSGEVIEANEKLNDNPETVNNDPYGEGWIAVIKVEDPEELKNLMSAKEYEEMIKGMEE